MGVLTFLIGGARSGKSALAVEIGRRHDGDVVFIATAQAFDDDMQARIDAHRDERPAWPTVEAPLELAAAIASAPADALVIVDCITVWVGNLFVHVPSSSVRTQSYGDVSQALADRSGPTIVISNEVGLGVHPETPLGREYRDELGRVNQQLARMASRSLMLVAGRALPLSDPLEQLS